MTSNKNSRRYQIKVHSIKFTHRPRFQPNLLFQKIVSISLKSRQNPVNIPSANILVHLEFLFWLRRSNNNNKIYFFLFLFFPLNLGKHREVDRYWRSPLGWAPIQSHLHQKALSQSSIRHQNNANLTALVQHRTFREYLPILLHPK